MLITVRCVNPKMKLKEIFAGLIILLYAVELGLVGEFAGGTVCAGKLRHQVFLCESHGSWVSDDLIVLIQTSGGSKDGSHSLLKLVL